jgi:hypothetical protein
MREIQYTELQPGQTYYIGYRNPSYGESGKKIGVFRRLNNKYGVPFAEFSDLRDLPNARLPPGLGSATYNEFSSLGYRFYLPTADEINLTSVLRQKTGDPYLANVITRDYNGGKEKKRKTRKQRKTKKQQKTKNNRYKRGKK